MLVHKWAAKSWVFSFGKSDRKAKTKARIISKQFSLHISWLIIATQPKISVISDIVMLCYFSISRLCSVLVRSQQFLVHILVLGKNSCCLWDGHILQCHDNSRLSGLLQYITSRTKYICWFTREIATTFLAHTRISWNECVCVKYRKYYRVAHTCLCAGGGKGTMLIWKNWFDSENGSRYSFLALLQEACKAFAYILCCLTNTWSNDYTSWIIENMLAQGISTGINSA